MDMKQSQFKETYYLHHRKKIIETTFLLQRIESTLFVH